MKPQIYFPGIQQFESADITLGHGATPAVFSLRIAPQFGTIAAGGTLMLRWSGQEIARFPDCRIEAGSLERTNSGAIVALSILDRRWKWLECGQISGEYNVRRDDGKIVKKETASTTAKGDALENTERKPRELAELCLEAMGEKNYDITDLPNDARPSVEWVYENPSQALARLVEELGCRIVLQRDNTVAIRKLGFGPGGRNSPMPSGPLTPNTSEGLDPPERPDALTLVTGNKRFQVDLELEAIGITKAGKYLPIDDLPYKPDGGWEAQYDWMKFPGVADEADRTLAVKSVGRLYRIKTPFRVPGYDEEITDLEQVLPIESDQVATVTIEDVKSSRKAIVFGKWFRSGTIKAENTAEELKPVSDEENDKTVCDMNFQIDTARGIVRFSEPVFMIDGDSASRKVKPAELVLRTAVSIRDPKTRSFLRYERERKLSGQKFDTKPRYVRRDEIVPTYLPTYEESEEYPNVKDVKVTDNLDEVKQECDYYLDATEGEYQTNEPQSAEYAGWLPINPDGALQSVTWAMGSNGAFTTVQRNQDQGSPSGGVLPYKLVRQIEKNKIAQQQVARLQPRDLTRTLDKSRGAIRQGGD